MKFNWKKIQKPIVALSPMADMTDSPYCRIVKSMANPVIFREMVSAEAIVRNNEKTLKMIRIHKIERPLVQQIFGTDPEVIARSASIIIEKSSPDGIDINMGCPVHKLTSNFNGAALMKDPDLASKIVRTVKKEINCPLSVKMRAGWSNHTECIEFAKVIEDAGADLISIHGRTKTQGYSGKANREVVAEVKSKLSIPVLYNGDINCADDFFKAIDETGCDGALIGRGALGNPWIFKQIENQLNSKEIKEPNLSEIIKIVKKHIKLHLIHYGPESLPTFRKHLSWYFKGVSNFKQFKEPLMTATTPSELDKIFDEVQNVIIL